MGLPRPDAGTPVHDYLAQHWSRKVILNWPCALPEAERLNGKIAWQKTGSLCPGVRNGVPGDPRDMVKSWTA